MPRVSIELRVGNNSALRGEHALLDECEIRGDSRFNTISTHYSFLLLFVKGSFLLGYSEFQCRKVLGDKVSPSKIERSYRLLRSPRMRSCLNVEALNHQCLIEDWRWINYTWYRNGCVRCCGDDIFPHARINTVTGINSILFRFAVRCNWVHPIPRISVSKSYLR